MAMLERPRVRPFLAVTPDRSDPQFLKIWDQRRLSDRECRVTRRELVWLQMFDGQRTLRDIQCAVIRQADGELWPLELFTTLVERMDEALLLDGPRFREFLSSNAVREPSCLDSYGTDSEGLRRLITALFTDARGPGLPRGQRPDGKLRAALIPHIDYARGGVTYAWGFKEVVERTDASLFVIIGTSHFGLERFTLTRKDFKTPLGLVRTDQAFIDRLVQHYGDGLFDDEGAHLPEHSIELEVVFLQYLYEQRRPIRIVPLLVGSFQDCVDAGSSPRLRTDVARMVEALRRAEAETPQPICYIISGDLAHIGPDFGDAGPLDWPTLALSWGQDQKLCQAAEAVDLDRYFAIIADESDARRICGLPPTYTLLEAARPVGGRLLHYDQYVHPRGQQSVSFASVAFYR
jgi:AmmeMemoRadiSam system protein B